MNKVLSIINIISFENHWTIDYVNVIKIKEIIK